LSPGEAQARQARIESFLGKIGWGHAARTPLAGDASFRRYERLVDGKGATAVLMDAPPERENVRPFVALARHLASLGLSAPRILEIDEAAGLLLLEDFGDANMARLVDGPGDKETLYALAIDTLIALHRDPAAAAAPALPFGEERPLREVGYVLDWYLPAIAGQPTSEALRAEYLEAWRRVLSAANSVPQTLVLFDFFPDNLMLLEGREGVAACGLLDFQDAVIGPVAYDVVSLLEDARRDVSPALRDAMLRRYLDAFASLDRVAFSTSYAVMGAQRNMRIIGVFTRLSVRDRKSDYLRHIPRVWRHVERSLQHPALLPVKIWLDRNIPPNARRAPACEFAP
jgi:N-acetylmuramate 1-kinase